MLHAEWTSHTIETEDDMQIALRNIHNTLAHRTSIVGGFDTETTGLNIKEDLPFLFVCGFIVQPKEAGARPRGYTYAVDLENNKTIAQNFIKVWQDIIAPQFPRYTAHNVKYDLHMMDNIGLRYTGSNISDTMFYIRYGCDHIPERFGGPPLALKKFSKQYIDRKAGAPESELQRCRSMFAKRYNIMLRDKLKTCPPPTNSEAKSWTLGVIEKLFKDQTLEPEDLPETIRDKYIEWFTIDLPVWLQNKIHGLVKGDDIPYDKIDRKVVTNYAHYDIIYMLETFLLMQPIVVERENMPGVEIEEQLIYPLVRMESVGFKIDVAYLKQARKNLKRYILQRRERMYELAGLEFKVSQHELIKELLNTTFGLNVDTTQTEEMEQLVSELIIAKDDSGAIEFIQILQELKTLEKWYAVYLLRFLNGVDKHGMLYTQLNQVGAVSGRFSSDFQQFPKEGISDKDGNELLNPRKIVLLNDEESTMVFMDYSQIELRLQAMYTILVGDADNNMCRAYMPYRCKNAAGETFDWTNREHILNWNGEWYYEECPDKRWIPTDLHGVTTEAATGLSPDDPVFKKLRSSVGKRVNFSKNYGAGWSRIRAMFPDKTEDEITRINDSYYNSYPGVKTYHNYCYDRARSSSNTANLFGVRYYNATGHKLINLLVQGSAAYLLKIKIIEIDKFLRAAGLKTRMQMQIHDEIMFKWSNSEFGYIPRIKQIMEEWHDTMVPIVAEVEFSKTNWAEKKEWAA